MNKQQNVKNEVHFINYTIRPKYYLLTHNSGCPSAEFNFPFHPTERAGRLITCQMPGNMDIRQL